MAEKLGLTMRLSGKSGRYHIWNGTDSNDGEEQQLLHFPETSEIVNLWKTFCPMADFSIEKEITRPVSGFWVTVGGEKTTPLQRQQFCAALLERCTIAVA